MEVATTSSSFTKWKPIEIMLALLFLVAPFYFQPNMGGRGLELPFNFGIWAAVSFIIFFALIKVIKKREIFLPRSYLAILALPILILISGFLAGIINPIEWLFRQVFILSGVLFLIALFQYEKPKSVDKVLFIIVVSTLLHSTIAVLQINQSSFMSGWYPQASKAIPIGMFQQVNNHATYLVTGILVAFYLQGREFITYSSIYVKATTLLAIGLSAFIVISTSSRIGLLALIVGLGVLLISYRKQFQQNKRLVVLSMVVLLMGCFLGKGGLDNTLDKTTDTLSGFRLSIYSISLRSVESSPIYGHGIGSFLDAWTAEAGEFHQENQDAKIPRSIKHPHNEILFWLIEGGLLSVVGILIFICAIAIALYRSGYAQAGAGIALLLPIGFHTQVELPFYTSSLHWFLWLYLIYMVINGETIRKDVSLSSSARYLVNIVSVVLLISANYFLINSARAQSDIYKFINREGPPPYLQFASTNLYSKPYAEQLAMRSILFNAISQGDNKTIAEFLVWAQQSILRRPELKLYEDVLNAYTALGDKQGECRAINEALQRYPTNKVLMPLNEQCLLAK